MNALKKRTESWANNIRLSVFISTFAIGLIHLDLTT